MDVLALIPARGGSKSIPRKNIKSFNGYPLIAHSIAAGLQSKLVTRVIVSTDDAEIARIAREFGAETPFIRPDELAGDIVLDLPVFQHALAWLKENEGYEPDMVVHLRPTAPIRPPGIVDEAIKVLDACIYADSARGITDCLQNPYKMWRIEDGLIHPLIEAYPESYNAPRQKLPKVYAHTGLIDVTRPETLRNSMSGEVIVPVFYDNIYSIDLDDPEDWEKAEQMNCIRVMVDEE